MSHARIGFVGCGTHSTNNLYPMLKYARAKLVATCDLDLRLAQRNAEMFGAAKAYTSVEQMLSEQQLDGVMVVGPSSVHYAVAKQTLFRGIPTFVEKPPADTLAQTIELVDLAKKHNTFLMTGFMKRHGLTYRKARQLIQSGKFQPAVGSFKYAHWASTDVNMLLLFMSSHIIDLALSFFGRCMSLSSTRYLSDRALSLAVTLQFESGRWAQLMLDASQPRIQEHVEISGSIDGKNALLVVDNVDHLTLHQQNHPSNGIDVLAPTMDQINPDFDLADIQMWRPDYALPNMGQTRHFVQGFAGEVREFCDAILDKRPPYPSMADALHTMQVIDAILKKPDGFSTIEPLPNMK